MVSEKINARHRVAEKEWQRIVIGRARTTVCTYGGVPYGIFLETFQKVLE
jgi:hypothetical protein